MHFHLITLFPSAFDSYLGESIIKRAIERKQITVSFYNPRDFTPKPSAKTAGKSPYTLSRVDRRPYGGGPGMVLEAESVLKAVTKAIGRKDPTKIKVIFFEPGGTQFDTAYAEHAVQSYKHIVMICGRYEGVDARVRQILDAEQVTIGPYTLTGGELPAMVVLDCMTRRLPGVLGHDESVEERRVASGDVYTRPEVLKWKGKEYAVPKVLLSGNRAEIDKWKKMV
ncbi:MAG: tRNA (guanosine(37)-N1)-methyltransferase TrmD [Candidatus Pacebacteria bacterium]|nr:tRNA (guanosine(37)-N1)-methyltransferase TrmD [Candidatus Paceibacterota bacterium]